MDSQQGGENANQVASAPMPENINPNRSDISAMYPNPTKGIVSASFEPVAIEALSEQTALEQATISDRPVPVVKVLSVRGVEYLFMSIFLWLSAGSFIGLVLSLFNGQTGFSALAFPLSMLLVCLPGLAFLFLRLKAAELADPSLKLEASKRRLTQITQLLAFLTCLINIITFVYMLLQKVGGEGKLEIGKAIVNMLVILIVAGGILVYYWNDEHKRSR